MSTSPPPPRRRFSPQPVETTVKKARKFAVEPVETTARSSKKEHIEEIEDYSSSKPRRFIPEPIETTTKSSKLQTPNALPTPEPTPEPIAEDTPAPETPKSRRKFAPQLIETTKRSKKAGDTRPATLLTDKTDITPGTNHIYVERKRRIPRPPLIPCPPENTPNGSTIDLHSTIPPLPPRRQPSMRPHPNTRRGTRQDSFRPELEPIESSESSRENSEREDDDNSTPSLSGSFGSSEDSVVKLQMARTRESCDDRFSGYLLALAAKAAEKQLREQALAAFPNESHYEIVEHFYDREVDPASDEETVEGIGMLVDDGPIPVRRKSTEVGWAAKEMQAHQEKLNRMREEETNKKLAAEATAPTFQDPFWTNGMTHKTAVFARGPVADKQREAELDRMRSAASPPMLGGDLKFRMCPSPKATKFESDQRHDTAAPHRSDIGGGLWGGFCVAEEAGEYLSPAIPRGPAMIHTPHSEREDPFSSAFASEICGERPKSSDERLKAEVARSKAQELLLEEFNEAFVTQVYNYLSLGYPALARQYDEELAKISRIPEHELKVGDSKRNAKGYIGLVDSPRTNVATEDHGGYCARWKALRIYILEWARQHPDMSTEPGHPQGWGVMARRGSWAI